MDLDDGCQLVLSKVEVFGGINKRRNLYASSINELLIGIRSTLRSSDKKMES